jgi:molybdopterin converting factor small subunit
MSAAHVKLKLFAALSDFTPDDPDRVAIDPGTSVRDLLDRLDIPTAKAHLIFIDGVKKSLDARLDGGERVGIFPPVAGG